MSSYCRFLPRLISGKELFLAVLLREGHVYTVLVLLSAEFYRGQKLRSRTYRHAQLSVAQMRLQGDVRTQELPSGKRPRRHDARRELEAPPTPPRNSGSSLAGAVTLLEKRGLRSAGAGISLLFF